MNQQDKINSIIETTRKKYACDAYKADRAFIVAPFGQKYFDESVAHLAESRAVKALAGRERMLVLIITSMNCDTSCCPDIFKVIQISPIKNWPAHDRYQNRFIKWAIPFLFKNVEASIYVDGNVSITNQAAKINNLFKVIERHKFINTKHSTRRGWEDELWAIEDQKRFLDKKKLHRQKIFFKSHGAPPGVPVCQNKFLGRVHSSEFDILNLEVLFQIFNYTERDQLGLNYAMHKTGKRIFSLPEGDILLTFSAERINPKSLCFVQDKRYYRKVVIHHYMKKYLKLCLLSASRPFTIEHRKINLEQALDKETVVLIVTCYEHLEFTKKCINSYYSGIDNDYNYVLLILDDQSSDETKDLFLSESFPNFCYLRFKHNKGLTRSWNYGVWFALKRLKADYIFIANNDIIIPKGSIERLISGLKSMPDLGVIGPLTNCPGFHERQNVDRFYSAYKPSDNLTDIQATSDMIKNGKVLEWDELNGFFFGGEKEVFEENKYTKFPWPYYFDPFIRDVENERAFQRRLRDVDMKIALAANTFIFHYKDISLERFDNNKKICYRDSGKIPD